MDEYDEINESATKLMYAPRAPFSTEIERTKFTDAINEFALKVRAELPCYFMWAEPKNDCDCSEGQPIFWPGDFPCPSCTARAKLAEEVIA